MKIKYIFVVLMAVSVFALLTGCSRVQTYTVEKARVDQNLAQGNRGYFMGQPSASEVAKEKERKMTRATYVTEVELGFPYKAKKKSATVQKQPSMAKEAIQEQAPEAVIQEAPKGAAPAQKSIKITSYTVEPKDTLQKISLKVYGTTKKWKKIYEANADQLKSPDRINVGRVLKIPQE